MNQPISTERYEEIASYCEDQELYHVWIDISQDFHSYEDKCDVLIWVVQRLVEEGRIKLVNMRSHEPLRGSVEEQMEKLRASFPKDESEMEGGLWFLLENCPAGSAWQHPENTPEIRGG